MVKTLEQYLRKWCTGKTTLYGCLRKECVPKETTSDCWVEILNNEVREIEQLFSASTTFALDGDSVEKTLAKGVRKLMPTMDIYVFQEEEQAPFTLIECKYRKMLDNSSKNTQTKVSSLYDEVCEKARNSKRFLESENYVVREDVFLVMNFDVAPIVKSNIMFYAVAEDRTCEKIMVVDTQELYKRLKSIEIQGL